MHAHDPAPKQEQLPPWVHRRLRAQQQAFHVAHAEPRHRLVARAAPGRPDPPPPRSGQGPVAGPYGPDDGLVRVTLERPHGHLRGIRGLGAVAQAIDGGDERAVQRPHHEVAVAGLGLAGPRPLGDGPLDRTGPHRFHRRTVTVVPLPKSETISNSSISRRVPGRPRPRPPEVEYPSCMASGRSGIPGPSSVATTSTPRLPLSLTSRRRISPRAA